MRTSNKGSLLPDRPSTIDLGDREPVDLELIDRIRSGDERSTEALLHRYRWLALHHARAFFLTGWTDQDVIQEAMIGLFKAIRAFEGASQTPFAAFADLCIRRQIASALKAATRYKHFPLNSALSLDLDADDDDWSDRKIADAIAGPANWDPSVLVVSSEQIESIRAHLTQTLTELESDVLELSMQGLSYQQICALLNAHRKRIDNALQRIRAKLRAYLAAQEEF